MEINQSESICLPLEKLEDRPVGGKAKGLSQLMAMGLNVPPGFVIVGATKGNLPENLSSFYQPLENEEVAVRSSAIGEDSEEASYAGQYDTLLNVKGFSNLESAVDRCLDSLTAGRSAAYRADHQVDKAAMSVVVQKMVDAAAAGVLFTADPVSGRRDCLIIDAVPGLGEELVSGRKSPDHFMLSRQAELLKVDLAGEKPVLDDEQLHQLLKEALAAEKAYGQPLDMEWAIDRSGEIFWLQARPITALGADPTELDWSPYHAESKDVFTTYNLGEILPGAVTPLTASVVVRPLDVGLQRQHVAFGIQDQVSPHHLIAGMRFGQLYINLTRTCFIGTNVAGASVDKICLAICGRVVPEVLPRSVASKWKQAINGAKFFRYVLKGKKSLKKMEAVVSWLTFPEDLPGHKLSAYNLWAGIGQQFPNYTDIFDYHMVVTSGAGLYEPILMQVMAKGSEIKEEHHARLASLLSGIENVESADLAAGLGRITRKLLLMPDSEGSFGKADPEAALQWLQSEKSGQAGIEFADYLVRHGHRALRELELRQKEWRADPLSIISSLQAGFMAELKSQGMEDDKKRELAVSQSPLGANTDFITGYFVRKIQEAVRRRERSKSLLIASTVKFKEAYRRLGKILIDEKKLIDNDSIFFLTHDELGDLIEGDHKLAQVAVARRKILDYQMGVRLPDVFTGKPEPLSFKVNTLSDNGLLLGTPVSCGKITGKARVVTTLDEAAAIEVGEILVTTVTDIGWTPYFSLIAGLAADIGSSISHGAVVAREYGLPAGVNLGNGTRVFKTGDLITLDGYQGTVELVKAAES